MKTDRFRKPLDIQKMHEDSDSYEELKNRFDEETRYASLCDAARKFISKEYSPLYLSEFSDLMSKYNISWRNPENYRSYLREVLIKEVAEEHDMRSKEMLALSDEMHEMTNLDPEAIFTKEYQSKHSLSYLKLLQMQGLMRWVFEDDERYFK